MDLEFPSCCHVACSRDFTVLLKRRWQEDGHACLQDGHLLPGSFQLDLSAERKQGITARQGLLCSLNLGYCFFNKIDENNIGVSSVHSAVQLQEPSLDYADVRWRNQPTFAFCNKTLHLLSVF